MEPFIGQIQAYSFNFEPSGWLFCNGQILSVLDYENLFSLIGSTYGGDGRTTFGLPDLRGRVQIGQGQDPGLSNYTIGQKGGDETVTIKFDGLPSHNHSFNVVAESPNQTKPANALIAAPDPPIYSDMGAPDATLATATIGFVNGDEAHNNMQPYLTINWCIAYNGEMPSQN